MNNYQDKPKYQNKNKLKIFWMAYELCIKNNLPNFVENIENVENVENIENKPICFFRTMLDLKNDGFNILYVDKLNTVIKKFNKNSMKNHVNLISLMHLKDRIILSICDYNMVKTSTHDTIMKYLIDKNNIIKDQIIVLKSFSKLKFIQSPFKPETYEDIFREEIINRLVELVDYFTINTLLQYGIDKITYNQATEMNIYLLCSFYNNTVDKIREQLYQLLENCFIYFSANNAIDKIVHENTNNTNNTIYDEDEDEDEDVNVDSVEIPLLLE